MLDYKSLIPLLEPFGQLFPQLIDDWQGEDSLPLSVAEFYLTVGPWGETHHEKIGPIGSTLSVGGNPVCIPPLHKLNQLQAGYAWSNIEHERLPGWNDDWLVIAEQGGDPFIFKRSTGEILFDSHGAGAWKPRLFAPNLVTGIGAIATVASAYCSLDESLHFEDYELTPQGRELITRSLADFVGNREQAVEMLKTWEYYL